MTRAISATGLICAVLACPAPVAAQTGQRLSDADVKQIIDDVDHARDRFEDKLDGKIKDSVIRGPRGEVRVRDYLQDYQDNVTKLKDRFSKSYSASAEAAAVLRQATAINAAIKSQPGEIKGGSEWDRLALGLGRLAEAYGTTFPLPDGGAVRRINDGEAASTAETIARQADEVKKAVGRESTLPKPDRKAIAGDLDALKDQAKTVKSRASDSKPATAEARQVMTLVGKVDDAFRGKQLSPATLSAWGQMRAPLETLQQAYAIKP
jgi:hypothetical protein